MGVVTVVDGRNRDRLPGRSGLDASDDDDDDDEVEVVDDVAVTLEMASKKVHVVTTCSYTSGAMAAVWSCIS